MNRFLIRLMLCLVCLGLICPGALAQDTDSGNPSETVIAPAYPVPDYVERLLEAARKEIGYQEERSGVTKYGIWSGDPAAEWCAEFLCWCVDQTDKLYNTNLLTRVYPYYTGTNVGRNWFLKQGRYIARLGVVPGWGAQWYTSGAPITPNSYIPQPGDWMFFSNNAAGDTNHVAMVEYCAYDAQGDILVYVIEGNNPSAVARRAYPIDYWAILGYGTVYDLSETAMRFGNEGEKVKNLQKKLAAAGLLDDQYVTGKYGDLTTRAVQSLQKQQGIEVTGIANFETQQHLTQVAADFGWVN